MTRKAFLADVTSTSEKDIPNILDVKRGDDDGDVNFVYVPVTGAPIAIGLLALDVSGYPAENNFMIFTKSSDIPPGVNEALEDIATFSAGLRIPELIQTVSQRLTKLLATGSQADPVSIDDDFDVQMLDGVDEGDDESEEDYGAGFDSEDDDNFGYGPPGGKASTSSFHLNPAMATKLNRRIKEDLRAVKFAGFKLGILSGLTAESQTSVLSISIQAAKVGLSDEAIQAWDLEPSQYIVILIRYSSGYKTFNAIIEEAAKSLDISFRIGVCDKYKPTTAEALAAFTEVTKDEDKTPDSDNNKDSTSKSSGFSSIFISSSLNEFINDQFISLLKIRASTGIGWDGAKLFFNDKQGRWASDDSALPSHYYEESKPKQTSLADMMYADHLVEDLKELSFPLIAAQFSMRYLLRCTEFCLVCHDQIEGDFEALKPYVCDKPLCLYQYMSLGFGPSVEHEILTQPYVVDLLVSFCYAAAYCQRIREYPTGMSLSVPPVKTHVTTKYAGRYGMVAPTTYNPIDGHTVPEIEVKFDQGRQEIMFEDTSTCPVRNGDWIVITVPNLVSTHYRVADISFFPTVQLSDTAVTTNGGTSINPAFGKSTTLATPATTPPPPALVPASVLIYDQNFDDMDEVNKAETIIVLLETLPPISELRTFLLQQTRKSEPNLRAWKERVSPAALGLLRWIIASNRSCIVQVDRCPGQEEVDANAAKIRLDQKCGNVPDNWLQFRFAQGSPDKEQRFLDSLKAEKGNFDAKYPTMFAFHGSGLQNWHSIIRHGLDFKETINGRAYGHGVYHAMDQNTSIGYAQASSCSWPASDLNITTAMSLNEIVNCPTQFTSSSPFMVVQHIDWIQARYLFVQTNTGRGGNNYLDITSNESPSAILEQDPKFTPKTANHKPIEIPRCAISVSRAFREDVAAPKPTNKRRKHAGSGGKVSINELIVSDEEEIEDVTFLFSDDENSSSNGKGKATEKLADLSVNEKFGESFFKTLNPFSKTKLKAPTKPMTDFVPGSLDQDSLPMLAEPAYATSSATMRINRDLKELLKIQKNTPLHELGWYLNPELVSNVYQWIVELHSFDSDLPLAKDMKAASVTSIVLEIRFPKHYPHSPPFIRVIRPRFLPFILGGGGHVTGGGAMCMELLTNSGWSSVSSIEGVLLQVRLAIMNLEPKPARLEAQGSMHQRDYGTFEAMQAYERACRTHGWQIPKDFQDFASGSDPGLGGSHYRV